MFNSKVFNQISFFLGNRIKVNSLETGAIKNGGATKLNDGIYSNIESDNFIRVNKNSNTLSVFIPSTLSADQNINNSKYIEKYYNIIEKAYNDTITVLKTKGSWYSEDMDKVIIEDITVLTVNIKEVTQNDVNFFLNLGLQVKNEMSQEAVSITINNSLCLV